MRIWMILILIGLCIGFIGCGVEEEAESDVVIAPIASIGSITPRFYKDGDTFTSQMAANITVAGVGTFVFNGTVVNDITDGGLVNGVACLLSTVVLDAVTNNPIAIAAGESTYSTTTKTWFWEDGTGLYICQTEDDGGSITDYGTGTLDIPYPIGGTANWADVAGNTYVLDASFAVAVNGHAFDAHKVIVNGLNDQYLSQELGGRTMVYGETELPEGNMFVEIYTYQLTP